MHKQDSDIELDALAPPVNEHLLRRVVNRIAERLPDACIVLFGSHAYGRPRSDSDIDLLVVTAEGDDPYPLAGDLYLRLRPRSVAVDLIVMAPDELVRRRAGFDPLLDEIVSKGRVLHGRLPE